MKNLIHEQSSEQSISGLLSNSFSIYIKHFFLFFIAYFLLVYPFSIYNDIYSTGEGNYFYWLTFFSYVSVNIIGTGAITIAISDAYLGRKPSIFSSYKRTFNQILGKLLVTQWLWIIGLCVSILLLVVPAFYFLAFFSFVVPVVMLEGRWGLNAFRRSKALSKGFYKRIGFIMAIVITGEFLLGEAFDIFASNLLQFLNISNARFLKTCISQVNEIFWPLIISIIVFMYYDLRTHKEFNESITIAEDLRH